MAKRIRGQEVTIRIAVDGETLTGSFLKCTEFSSTVRSDIVETDFLGELETDLDFQHHGFDFSFSVQEEDSQALDYLNKIIELEQQARQHPDITVTVIHQYRDPSERTKVEVFHDCYLKVNESGFSGRKEFVTHSFEGKAKRRSLMTA